MRPRLIDRCHLAFRAGSRRGRIFILETTTVFCVLINCLIRSYLQTTRSPGPPRTGGQLCESNFPFLVWVFHPRSKQRTRNIGGEHSKSLSRAHRAIRTIATLGDEDLLLSSRMLDSFFFNFLLIFIAYWAAPRVKVMESPLFSRQNVKDG